MENSAVPRRTRVLIRPEIEKRENTDDLLPVPIAGRQELREEEWRHLNNFTGNYRLTLVAPRSSRITIFRVSILPGVRPHYIAWGILKFKGRDSGRLKRGISQREKSDTAADANAEKGLASTAKRNTIRCNESARTAAGRSSV